MITSSNYWEAANDFQWHQEVLKILVLTGRFVSSFLNVSIDTVNNVFKYHSNSPSLNPLSPNNELTRVKNCLNPATTSRLVPEHWCEKPEGEGARCASKAPTSKSWDSKG